LKPWINFQAQNLYLLVLVFILSFLIAFFSYRYTLPPLSSRKKTLLLLLRWIALFCLFLATAETIFGISFWLREKPKIALLLDSSRSMNIKEQKLTRKDIMQGLLKEKDFREKLSKAEIYTYLFSDSLRSFNLLEEIPPSDGEVTSIGNSLEGLRKKLKGEGISAVILISDGANNKGKNPADIARDYPDPIYTVGVGEFVPFKDISIEEVEYEEVIYYGEKDTIVVTVKNQGYGKIKIPVILQEGTDVLARQELQFNFSGEVQETGFIIQAGPEGIHKYQVVVPKIEGESFQQNNRRNLVQNILKKRFKILLVTQELNWEYTFLKRALKENKDITLESLVISNSSNRISDKIGLNQMLEECDLLVLLDSPRFLVANQKKIRDILQDKGVSLLILVGKNFYERGDLSSQLDFLPFQLKKEGIPLSQNFNLKLTPEGRHHPVTRLSDDSEENLSLWINLPPFERLIPLTGKDGVKVLATSSQEQKVLPAIMVKVLWKGKIEILSVSPWWKWDFLPWGIGKGDSAYGRFWENSFKWLLSKEDMKRFKVSIDKEVYKRGEEIKFTSRLLDESYQKIRDADIRVKIYPEVEKKDSLNLNLFQEESGFYSFTLSFLTPGKYIFKGEARKEELILGTSTGEFKVEKTSIEDEELRPDKDLLREISHLSGGEYFEPENFPSLLKSLDLEKKLKVETLETPVWNQPLLLFLFILLLSLEWFFRKRFQLL